MDHLDQAIYNTVHNADLSTKELAQQLGISPQVLINKANPTAEYHKLSLRESIGLQKATNNFRIHEAVGIELEIEKTGVDQSSVLKAVLSAAKEHGDVVRAVQEGMSNRSLTAREAEICQVEISESIEALHSLRKTIVKYQENQQQSS